MPSVAKFISHGLCPLMVTLGLEHNREDSIQAWGSRNQAEESAIYCGHD